MTDEIYKALSSYLQQLADAEYKIWLARKKPRKTDRFSTSDYHRELTAKLGRNDEEGFKALKMLQGYASALGV